ncbi:hypothetical protein HRR83_003348 [Exophiala dermatitidis]|uniref:Citrate synthase n=2 Tax=Exophiala dermatitidis TaxID=5970 RepID=H6BMQ8_EXODN|nr:citrate synthase [Exophiala dermatitidis NIH/UT8656]KAJ4518199.1 hypothetical protein HRR74_004494 [Exophiala dermatitidis]EHY52086.1 citrate synthase [Exophiala dermatitidis NIH/UT8656]KAJ4521097.1 hypothetical protein HRR73_003438 [Exophiala dermatitidis]KAJ4547681.1 hypothetical protein HRR76_000312 [Exophiala dermatitidis]KAJ4553619.1 hypothetical protein HRR77_002000 [Exophiala dermatitidis]
MNEADGVKDSKRESKDEPPMSSVGSPAPNDAADYVQESKDGSNRPSGIEQQTNVTKEPPEKGPSTPTRQYSVWNKNEKRLIIATGSLAGFFSPLSSSIYFPALNTIADALNVSGSQINLTVTTYLILQGAAPMMIAGFSDNMGRRPAYMLCFIIYLAANLGLALQNSYAALLVLRCLQSAGSSGTVALANGLVGDTVTSEERGQYIAFASLGGLLGPSVSPIIGGAISQSLDWHWIFWFLLIFSGVFTVPLFLFLPETCRKIVGDGSIPPPPLNWSLTDYIRHRRRQKRGQGYDPAEKAALYKNYRFRFPNPIPTIMILLDPESLIILVATGLALACFYGISTGASASFKDIYGFNNIQIALMFIPIGVGGMVSAITTGKLIDWNYRRHARKQGVQIIRGVRQDLTNFPIEQARIEVALPLMILCSVFVIGYGWTMDHKVSIAGPVILLFLLGYSAIATYQTLNVLMTDIWPGKAASATAANNFVRCELGAAASAAIDPMSQAMGRGWAYTTLALIYLAFAPALVVLMRRGIEMRKAKREREERRKTRKEKKVHQQR